MPEAALQATGLVKRFGGLVAVSDVSLTLRRGEVHALIGPNGAGKSTVVNLLSGELPCSAGQIRIGGRPATRLRPDQRARGGLGRSYQTTTVFPRWTAFENVRLAAQAHSARPLSPLRRADRDGATAELARSALAEIGLERRADILAGALSHGEQRQLEIGMVLATRPAVILLDEPLAGMGQAEANGMIRLIASLKASRALLLVEHDMDAVFALADVLTVMADGRVIAQGEPSAVRDHPDVLAAYLGPALAGASSL